MKIVNEYRIKPGITLDDIKAEINEKMLSSSEGGSYVSKDAVLITWHGLADDITADIAFPKNLSKWNSYDYVIIMDEMIGQPYYPFYKADEDENERFPKVLSIIGSYNKFMDTLSFLEKIS